jgi:glycosyltransferase involved in cell wall biosynthesis
LITDLQIGGTPRVVKELAIRLRPFGFDTRVACLSPWGPVADELRSAGVPVTALGAQGSRDIFRTVRLARSWLADADVVISFLVHANAVAAWAVGNSGIPLIQSIQTTQPRPSWHWGLQGWVGGSARRIVVPSQSVVSAAVSRSGLAADLFTVIPNALDLPESLSQRKAEGPFRVGFIGRLDPVKRVPDLVAALANLPNMQLSIFGEGRARPEIEAAIQEYGLGERVTLHGQVESADDALRQIDLLVLPSEAEGFGLVLIEAMAAGVPVVATRVPGIIDVISDGRTGLLVQPNNSPQLASAIRRLATDEPLRSSLIQQARADVQARFTWDRVLPQYVRLLNSV